MADNFLMGRFGRNILSDKIALAKRLLIGSDVKQVALALDLPNSSVEQGGLLKGELKISGGSISCIVEQILLYLYLEYQTVEKGEARTVSVPVKKHKITDCLMLGANCRELCLPFKLGLPPDMPISSKKTRYKFVVEMDLHSEPKQHLIQEIWVEPSSYAKIFLDGLTSLGFHQMPSGGEYIDRYQRFKYRTAGRSEEQLNLYLLPGNNELSVILEFNQQSGKSNPARFTLPYARVHNAEQVGAIIQGIIKKA